MVLPGVWSRFFWFSDFDVEEDDNPQATEAEAAEAAEIIRSLGYGKKKR